MTRSYATTRPGRHRPVCYHCHYPIAGEVRRAMGRTYHPHHFLCADCRQPIRMQTFETCNGFPYHEVCFPNISEPICVFCAKPVESPYLVDDWGGFSCASHETEDAVCMFCLRPSPQVSRILNTPRVHCEDCAANAIESDFLAVHIIREGIAWMSQQGLLLDTSFPFRFWVVSADELNAWGPNDPDTLGKAISLLDPVTNDLLDAKVLVMRGIPSPSFEATAIHELGHVWLAFHKLTGLAAWQSEGFCELLAYRWLVACDSVDSRAFARLLSRQLDHVYGGGFSVMQTLAEAYGFENLVDYIIRHGTTPSVP